MNKEQKQARNFQAKHRARKQINFDLAETENSKQYWEGFYNPFNAFLGLCNKRELAFLIENNSYRDAGSFNVDRFTGTVNEICEENTRNEIGEWVIMKLQFKNNSHPDQQKWFESLPNRCYFVCENGQDIKI